MSDTGGDLTNLQMAQDPTRLPGLVAAMADEIVELRTYTPTPGPDTDGSWRADVTRRQLQARAERLEMRSDIRELKADVSELKADVSELKTDVSELKTDVSELKTDVSELKTDVSELKTDVSELKTDVSELKTDVGEIRTGMLALARIVGASPDQQETLFDDPG